MFLDKIAISLKAGNGGNGSVNFYRDKITMNGGPDGGNGGKGGDIYFVADAGMTNLIDFRYKKVYKAEDGLKGEGNKRFGKSGNDLTIKIPLGTVIKDFETDKIIADFLVPNEPKKILTGGVGGRGNYNFANSRRQSPYFCETGEITKEFKITLELKTIADVGLVGYPSVGKSKLLSILTSAKPKIADYHFTTLVPNLGVSSYGDVNFLIADIPGLIEGASIGKGLGLEFLRHIERTRLIVHLIDIAEVEERNALEDFVSINNELKSYSENLTKIPQIIALNKIDLLLDNEKINEFKKVYGKDYDILEISCVTTKGINELKQKIVEKLSKIPPKTMLISEIEALDVRDYTDYKVEKLDEHIFTVSGGFIDKLIRGIIVNDTESFSYFQKRLKNQGIFEEMKKLGAVDGDTVIIKDIEFEYYN